MSCEKRTIDLVPGIWRGTLKVQDQVLPFNFEVTNPQEKSYQIHLINGDERLISEDVRIRGDSLFASMHIFDTEIRGRLTKGAINGVWSKKYDDDYQIPFHARFGLEHRFPPGAPPVTNITGKWKVSFSKDTVSAIGLFQQTDSRVLGTFLTSSGDYRYLEGSVTGDSLFLSAFDGEHAFLFTARIKEDKSLNGAFRSGNHWIDSWTAVSDANAQILDQDSITFLKPEYDRISFSFPDLNGKTVSLTDKQFRNKVIILQLFGSWCPNCMDETKFLSAWHHRNQHRPVEVIGLAYERLDDFSYAKSRLNKMAMKFGVNYPLLVAGTSDKDVASKTLPMLSHVNSFPTTIFIDHKGNVRRIFTGFQGPGTGQYFKNFTKDFESFVDGLIAEQVADSTIFEL